MKKLLLIICALTFIMINATAQITPVNRQQIIFDGKDRTHKFLSDGGSSFTKQIRLFDDIDFSSYELLSTNVSFTDKDQAQKIVFAPFRLSNNPMKFNALANTKINFSLKDKITTIGIAFGGDNTAPFTARANRIRARLFPPDLPAPPPPKVPAMFEDYVIGILAKNVWTAAETDSLKTLLKDKDLLRLLDQIRGHSPTDSEIKSLQDLYHGKKLQAVFEAYNKTELAKANKSLDSLLLLYDKAIAKHTFKWSVGYNYQLFANLFSSGTVNNFDSLNYFNSKAHNLSATFTYGIDNNNWVFSAAFNQIFARATAEKTQKVVPYYGPSATISHRVFQFVKQVQLDTMASYKKNLFVPSLNIGLGYEGKFANGNLKYQPYYQDKIKTARVFTPFIDLLFTQALQFRIAVPITKLKYADNKEIMTTGATLQYNLKLSSLSL